MAAPIQTAPAVDCRKLVPDTLRKDIPSAKVPDRVTGHEHVTLGDIEKFADTQTGQLDTANARGDLLIGVIDACGQANDDIAKKLTKPWWKVW